jgi:hypothetical protein
MSRNGKMFFYGTKGLSLSNIGQRASILRFFFGTIYEKHRFFQKWFYR